MKLNQAVIERCLEDIKKYVSDIQKSLRTDGRYEDAEVAILAGKAAYIRAEADAIIASIMGSHPLT